MPRPRERLLIVGAAALLLSCAPALLRASLAVPRHVPLDYNEGWHAYHSEAALSARDLYPQRPTLFFNNYPPLSFVIVAASARPRGDAIVAGRLVSLTAFAGWTWTLFAASRRMRCSRAESAFAAALFVAYTLAFSSYVGIDDPEFLAHAVQGISLLLLLDSARDDQRPTTNDERPTTNGNRTLATAACFAAGVFVKQNAIALPAAATAWLLVVDPPRARRLAAGCAAFGIAGVAVCVLLFGPQFLFDVMAPRLYSLSAVASCALRWAIRMPVFIAALVGLCRTARRDRYVIFCATYAASATALGLVLLGGAGVDWNVMFDSNAAFCLSSAVALNRLPATWRSAVDLRRLALAGAYGAAVVVGALLAARAEWLSAAYWLAPHRVAEVDARRDVEFLANAAGPAMCEDLALCYWAGKPAEVDVFNWQQRVRRGARHAEDLTALIGRGYFGAIQLGARSLDLDRSVLDALSRRYVVDHTDRFGVFLVRDDVTAENP